MKIKMHIGKEEIGNTEEEAVEILEAEDEMPEEEADEEAETQPKEKAATFKFKIKPSEPSKEEEKPKKTISLKARRALNGDVLISDSNRIDIVLSKGKKKVMTFEAPGVKETQHQLQLDFLTYLARKGIVDFDTIVGGPFHGSMVANLLESEDYNVEQLALVAIHSYIVEEIRPFEEFDRQWDEKSEQRLLEPPEGEYSEFDPDRHAEEKGSIKNDHIDAKNGLYYRY